MLNLPPDEKGVLITRVDPDSIAAAALEVGDVIEQVGQEPIGSLGDFEKALRQLPSSGPLTLSVVRKQTHVMVALNPG
jgi:S1-C subfamily serine protease